MFVGNRDIVFVIFREACRLLKLIKVPRLEEITYLFIVLAILLFREVVLIFCEQEILSQLWSIKGEKSLSESVNS